MAGGDLGVVTSVTDCLKVDLEGVLRVKVASAMIGKQHAV